LQFTLKFNVGYFLLLNTFFPIGNVFAQIWVGAIAPHLKWSLAILANKCCKTLNYLLHLFTVERGRQQPLKLNSAIAESHNTEPFFSQYSKLSSSAVILRLIFFGGLGANETGDKRSAIS
jgi:hypothetical protein